MAVSSVRNSRKYILLQKLIIIKKIGMSIANEKYSKFKKVLKKITLYVYVSPLMTIQEERVGGHFIMQWLDK